MKNLGIILAFLLMAIFLGCVNDANPQSKINFLPARSLNLNNIQIVDHSYPDSGRTEIFVHGNKIYDRAWPHGYMGGPLIPARILYASCSGHEWLIVGPADVFYKMIFDITGSTSNRHDIAFVALKQASCDNESLQLTVNNSWTRTGPLRDENIIIPF